MSKEAGAAGRRSVVQSVGLWLGPAIAILLQLLPIPAGLEANAWVVASMLLLMVTWWITEAIPIPVTALIPLIILPLFGVTSMGVAADPYSSPTIMLLLGGFIIATSIEKWGLHSRIALTIVSKAGIHPAGIVGGFMLASAVLSMWISNSATTIMLAPIAVSVAYAILGDSAHRAPFTIAIMLGLAYGASIGGIATPVGTPTNLIVIGYLEEQLGVSISFAMWMSIGVPVVALMLPACWLTVTRLAIHIKVVDAAQGQDTIRSKLARLGAISRPERRVLVVFMFIALAWILRQPLNALEIAQIRPFAGLTDHVIAVGGAVVLFLIPAGSESNNDERLLDWDSAARIPWGILLLFGGGLSMAGALTKTGLATWLGGALTGLTSMPLLILIIALVIFVIFATELISNVAAASALLPIIGALAMLGNADPVLLSVPIALAASCAFMLPIATGPNAIVFASNEVSIFQMARVGLVLNLFGIVLISAVIYLLAPHVTNWT